MYNFFPASFSCPKIANIEDKCGARIENICFSDSDCPQGRKCCPRAADGGCSLICEKPRVLGKLIQSCLFLIITPHVHSRDDVKGCTKLSSNWKSGVITE